MTPQRKKEIREVAIEAKGGLGSLKSLPNMQQSQIQRLIIVLETLTGCIIELTEFEKPNNRS